MVVVGERGMKIRECWAGDVWKQLFQLQLDTTIAHQAPRCNVREARTKTSEQGQQVVLSKGWGFRGQRYRMAVYALAHDNDERAPKQILSFGREHDELRLATLWLQTAGEKGGTGVRAMLYSCNYS